MKKPYKTILALLLFLGMLVQAPAQIGLPSPKALPDSLTTKGDNLKIGEFEITPVGKTRISKGINPPCDCAEGHPDITIGYSRPSFVNNYNTALAVQNAWADRWYARQRDVVKDEINELIGGDFPSFEKAQEALYKAIEVDIVNTEIPYTINTYKGKVAEKNKIRERCLRNIKLLDLRAKEFITGRANNSRYGHIKLYGNGDIPLKDIKTIGQLNQLRAQEVKAFGDNQWQLDREENILGLLNGLQRENSYWNSRTYNPNNGLLDDLYRKQLSYYNNFNDFERLGLIQLSMDRLKNKRFYRPPYGDGTRWALPLQYHHLRVNVYGNGDYIGDYALRKNPARLSPFHPEYWKTIVGNIRYGERITRVRIEKERKDILNEALNGFDLGKALAGAAISGLGQRNEGYINSRSTLKAEVENYLKLNDYSKVSNDCINYLLNQYLDGGHFTLGKDYYKSARPPVLNSLNSRANPNIAIGTSLNRLAVQDEFTYFNNVLAALFADSVHRPEYKGQIIRELFQANGIRIPAGMDNRLLHDYFDFVPTAPNNMRIDHARGHGSKANLDQYLRDLKAFHDDVQGLLRGAPTGMNQLAYIDYGNRVAEVLNFTNDAGAQAIAEMFSSEIARNNYLKLQHHRAITDSAHDILRTGFAEGLELRKLDPEGLRIVTREAAEISAIDDIAEDVGRNGDSFWPRNAAEWQAFGEMMVPLIGEIIIGFTPVGDYYDLIKSINSGDVLGASLAIGGIIISSTALGPIKGAIKGARAFRKALKIYRKLRGVLGAVGKVTKKGFKVTLDAAGNLIVKKGNNIIARGDEVVKGLLRKLGNLTDAQLNKFNDLIEQAARKGQKWDNPEAVADAVRKVSDEGIDGVSLSHKKFPAPADGSDSFTLKNAKQYQKEASGDAALSFNKNGVSFDNIANGKLIDRKFGHSSVFDSAGNVSNRARADSLVEQARRQLSAAGGNPIRWEISSVGGTNGIKRLFRDRGINIEVIHVPQITIIP